MPLPMVLFIMKQMIVNGFKITAILAPRDRLICLTPRPQPLVLHPASFWNVRGRDEMLIAIANLTDDLMVPSCALLASITQ